jgi:hypothetical protein
MRPKLGQVKMPPASYDNRLTGRFHRLTGRLLLLHVQLRLHQIQHVEKRIVRIVGVTNKAPSHLRIMREMLALLKPLLYCHKHAKQLRITLYIFPGFYTATICYL